MTMPASSPSGGSACASSLPPPPPPPPRTMKRELAFALQSLSEISASPGRTRSGRPISSLPDPSASASLKRRKRSDPPAPAPAPAPSPSPAADLVSPPTPPIDAEPPNQPLRDIIQPLHGSNPPTACDHRSDSNADQEVIPQTMLEAPQPCHAETATEGATVTEVSAMEVVAKPNLPAAEDSAAEAVAADDSAMEVIAMPAEDCASKPNVAAEDGASEPNVAAEDAASKPNVAPEDTASKPNVPDTAPVAPTLLETTIAAGNDQCDNSNSNGASLQRQLVDNVLISTTMLAEDAATPAAAAELKPARRFTRSLLKNNKPDREESAASGSQETPDGSKDASFDFDLLLEKPQRRFTRSLLKTKVEGSLVASDDALDSASDSPPSVKKMEMKMSKKVACLTKHPGNIRELLNTGLLEGMPVMYIIPHSKKAVLKGVITGCNIRCFCLSCNGSKAVSAYYFEQHAGSTKKHPADYIYLGNGNSLRDVLRASDRSPLEALEKTIRSSIDPVVKRGCVNCLNCNEPVLPSSQTESVLCQVCLESKQPQDPLTASYTCNGSSSLSPSSKDVLLKNISGKKAGSAGKVTNKDNRLHKLVFNVLLDGTEVAYYVDGKRKVDGYIKDHRIYCNHCNRVVSPSAFEAHAGEGSRRKPYDYIFTSNGVSLHELAMKISKDMEQSERETDDLCRECGQGGDIFPCKICPRSFHPACVGLSKVPSEWYCDSCRNLVQKEKALAENKNAKAAGRQAGVDSIEQIMKRAIRIVPICDDLGGCALCKQKDFNNAVFDERTVILCDQCEKEYHVGCLQSQWQVELKELPEGEWFCCSSCSETRSSLDKIISDGAQLLAEPDLEIIKKKHETRGLCMDTSKDLKWQLLSGKRATEEGSILLSAAVPIFHQSFDPIREALTGRDLIPEMVNGRGPKEGMPGQDYSGMFCAVLTLGSTVVSAALLRVMGGDVAELPLVATSQDVQGLGYFQALFSCIERVLVSLKIKHFVLPAAHEAEGIWMNKFGFSRVPPEKLEAYLNGAHMTIFHGTSYLYKAVQCRD